MGCGPNKLLPPASLAARSARWVRDRVGCR